MSASSALFTLPADYKYVAASLSLLPAFSFYFGLTVNSARAKYNVPLPALFASDSEVAADPRKRIFNCVQKSYLNFNDHMPAYFAAALVAGVEYPKAVAVGTLVWLFGRFFYHVGYSTGDPAKRVTGALSTLVQMTTIAAGIYSSVKRAWYS